MRFAKEAGAEIAVRSGGHSGAGYSTTDGGIVIDLRELRDIDLDVGGRRVWAGTGLTAGDVGEAVTPHGLVVGFGDTSSVGIGGITTGGGVGYLVRRDGLTIDNLVGAEIVTADGQVLTVDADDHPDLFWAIRGGGGNFGVVTKFHYRLNELPSFYGGMIVLPATPETVAGFVAAAEAAPEELSTIANVMTAPPMPFLPEDKVGSLVILGMIGFAGDAEAGERAVAPFRALAEPMADFVAAAPYSVLFPEMEGGEEYHPTAAALNLHLDHVDRDVAATIVDFLEKSDATLRVAQLRVLGGAMARVPSDATAYAHRSSKIMVNLAAFYEGPAERPPRRPGSATSPRPSTRATRRCTRTSSATRVRSASATRTRARPGIGWSRSSADTTRPTCSASTRTSRPDAGRLHPAGVPIGHSPSQVLPDGCLGVRVDRRGSDGGRGPGRSPARRRSRSRGPRRAVRRRDTRVVDRVRTAHRTHRGQLVDALGLRHQ